MSNKDYYKILGVPENADTDTIKKAYRKLALKYHPDRVSKDEKKNAEAKFKDISEAYYCLSDKNRRQEYDTLRRGGVSGFQGDFAGAHGFDFDEIMKAFRESAQSARGREGINSFNSGFDIDEIFDIFNHMGQGGTQNHYTFRNDVPGVKAEQTDVHAQLNVPEHLLINGGEAKFKHKGKDITLKIKAGTKHGQKLRLKGQGKMCPCCRHLGDLIVLIN